MQPPLRLREVVVVLQGGLCVVVAAGGAVAVDRAVALIEVGRICWLFGCVGQEAANGR